MRAGRRNERFGKGAFPEREDLATGVSARWPRATADGFASRSTANAAARPAAPRLRARPYSCPRRCASSSRAGTGSVAHAQQQAAAGPVVGQRDQADGHGARVRLGGQPRQDADAAGGRHHAADRVETADLDAQLHRPAQPAAFLGQPRRQRGRRRQAHVVVGQRVGEGDASLAGQRMALRHDQHQLVAPVRCGDEAGRGRAVGEDADVGAVLLDGGDDVVAILFFQVDAHGRMRFHEGGQVSGRNWVNDEVLAVMRTCPRTPWAKSDRVTAICSTSCSTRSACTRQAWPASVNLDAGGVAVEQLGVQRGLQVGDALAGRAHGQVRLTRAGRDAALAGHRDE